MIYIVQLPFTLRGVATESELNEVLECCRTDERVEAAMESIFSGRRFAVPIPIVLFQGRSLKFLLSAQQCSGTSTPVRLACGPPVDLEDYKYAEWVPDLLASTMQSWLERVFASLERELLVGQVGILFGERGLPLQAQHRDHHERHLVFLLRLSGHQSPTLFSSRPPLDHSHLEYYYDMFEMNVERGDALIFDGSVPHGQGAIPADDDTWTIFATLHPRFTFREGFPNMTLNHSTEIYRALTTDGKGWEKEALGHFYDYPIVLQQVCITLPASHPAQAALVCVCSFSGTPRFGAHVAKNSKRLMVHLSYASYL